MIELYLMSYNEDLFLSPLEHVHVGNIFVKEDICLLGGYENRLLGYRPRLYSTTEKSGLLLYIDVIMFGEWVWPSGTLLTDLPSQVM